MKAGIYKRRDTGKHIYIAKDRGVRAYQSELPNSNDVYRLDGATLVNTQQKEQQVVFPVVAGGMVVADRVADAPNGCTDHAQALHDYLNWLPRTGQQVLDDIEATFGPGEESDPVADSASRQQRMLSEHPPAVQTEDLGTDLTDSEPATSDFAQRAADQVDTVVAYEHAKKQLQVMLHCEEEALVRWNGNDWEVRWPQELKEMLDNPPKILPVLPRGWVAERAAQYVGNARANGPIDKGLKEAMRVVLGSEGCFCKGGLTGPDVPGASPAEILPSGHLVGVDFAKLEARVSAMPKWALKLPVGAGKTGFEQYAKDFVAPALDKAARHLVDGFRLQFTQANHLFNEWREYEFRMVLAHIVEAAHVYQDEVTVLDPIRFDNLEADVRAGRYANMGTHIVDTDTGVHYGASVEKRAIIKHLLNAKPNYVVTSGLADPIPAELGDRRYHVVDDSTETWWARQVQRGAIRLIGKQSKRKHKRAGHRVFWCAPLHSWAWEVRA